MGTIIIRKSNLKDIDDIAQLIYYTEKYPNEEWGGNCKEECYRNIKTLIMNKNTRYNNDYIWVAEKDEKILGMIVLIPCEELLKLTVKTSFITASLLKGLYNKILYGISTIEYLIFKEYTKETLYLSNVATNPEARGLGVGKILMNFAEEKAKEYGYKGVSLMAKNEEVSKFYEKLCYKKILDKYILGERVIKMEKIITV